MTYNTTSDYRLKENVQALTGGLARVDHLKPARFSFKADVSHTIVDGFIAHEVQQVAPYAVTGKKDAVDKNGKPIMQQMDYGKLTPLLTAAIQDLHKLVLGVSDDITGLKAENKALRSHMEAQEKEMIEIRKLLTDLQRQRP